jgi:flagellar hook-associated protein 2
VSATPVTVAVTRDDAAVADGVVQLVGLANALLTQIAKHTKYDAATRTAGLLGGDPMVRRLATDVRSAITGVVAGSSLAVAANIGIVTKRDGTMEVDRQRLLDALAADPDAVRDLFERGGAGTGSVTYAASGDLSVAGTYDVVVTTAPTRATSGVVLVGGTPAGQQLGVRVGATTVTYDAAAGSTPTEIAAGLSAALASAGLAVTADVDAGGVRLRAAAYGTGGNFDYDVGAGWQSAAGTSVAGTIGGVAAIGIGDRLSLGDLVDSPARGVAVTVADGAAGAVGSVTVQPGIAARLSSLAARLTAPDGAFTSAKDGYDRRVQRFNEQIDRFEERMERIESNLVRQWSTIQRNLQSLQNQGNWLASQIGALAPAS